jgi:hypothetical protein
MLRATDRRHFEFSRNCLARLAFIRATLGDIRATFEKMSPRRKATRHLSSLGECRRVVCASVEAPKSYPMAKRVVKHKRGPGLRAEFAA